MEKKTLSICPECRKKIPARIYDNDSCVYIEKECPDHGHFKDVYWSDYHQFQRAEGFSSDGEGFVNPRTQERRGCPYDCGPCPQHLSYTLLGIIDLTNRCNLKCPICFANAASAGYIYEPSMDQIKQMLENLRSNRPLPTPALQLSGGEPTLREDLPEIIKLAKKFGFRNVQVNTNGLRLAESLEYCKKLKKAGLQTLYLQFDGLTPDVYWYTRGRDLVATKMKAVGNCRRAGIDSIVLVMTLINGINDNQVGDVIKFAAENFDVIRCINVQPVSFSGRLPEEELLKRRITIPQFMTLVEEQTDRKIQAEDFFPVPSVVPVSQAIGALKRNRYPEFTAHPHCGMATYFFVDDGDVVPINKYIDVDRFLTAMSKVFKNASNGHKVYARFLSFAALRFIKFGLLRKYIWPLLKTGTYEALRDIHYRMILISSMHFMDAYNFDLERVKRCVIHYATPDGRIIPFCTYNNLGYREEIERTYSDLDLYGESRAE